MSNDNEHLPEHLTMWGTHLSAQMRQHPTLHVPPGDALPPRTTTTTETVLVLHHYEGAPRSPENNQPYLVGSADIEHLRDLFYYAEQHGWLQPLQHTGVDYHSGTEVERHLVQMIKAQNYTWMRNALDRVNHCNPEIYDDHAADEAPVVVDPDGSIQKLRDWIDGLPEAPVVVDPDGGIQTLRDWIDGLPRAGQPTDDKADDHDGVWGFGDSQECARALGRMLDHWAPEYLKQMIDQEQQRRQSQPGHQYEHSFGEYTGPSGRSAERSFVIDAPDVEGTPEKTLDESTEEGPRDVEQYATWPDPTVPVRDPDDEAAQPRKRYASSWAQVVQVKRHTDKNYALAQNLYGVWASNVIDTPARRWYDLPRDEWAAWLHVAANARTLMAHLADLQPYGLDPNGQPSATAPLGVDLLAEELHADGAGWIPSAEQLDEVRRDVDEAVHPCIPPEELDKARRAVDAALTADLNALTLTGPRLRSADWLLLVDLLGKASAEEINAALAQRGWRVAFDLPMSYDADNSVIAELCQAIAHTVEYVGTEVLHPGEGWSWYDALAKYRPHYLRDIVAHHERVVQPAQAAKAERARYPLGIIVQNGQRYGITGWQAAANEMQTMTVEPIT